MVAQSGQTKDERGRAYVTADAPPTAATLSQI